MAQPLITLGNEAKPAAKSGETISSAKSSQLAGAFRSPEPNSSLAPRVQEVLNLIRPAVQADGGDIELVDVTADGTVKIRFHGACHGCPSSTMTLQMGIEKNLVEQIPGIKSVIPVN